jgi:CheY-like chemotaxis protein
MNNIRNDDVAKLKTKILIVEDDRITAMSIKLILESAGYNVVGIGQSGEHATELAKSLKPDLVLMDINLGKGINGIEAAKLINKSKKTAIIFLSGNTHLLTEEILGDLMPLAVLSKPIIGIELREIINKLTDSEGNLFYDKSVIIRTDKL